MRKKRTSPTRGQDDEVVGTDRMSWEEELNGVAPHDNTSWDIGDLLWQMQPGGDSGSGKNDDVDDDLSSSSSGHDSSSQESNLLFDNDDACYTLDSNEVFRGGQLLQKEVSDDKRYALKGHDYVFPESGVTLTEFCRYLYLVRSKTSMTDTTFCVVFSAIVSFFPIDSGINKCLDRQCSYHDIWTFVKNHLWLDTELRTYKFSCCRKGCTSFVDANTFFCPTCQAPKYRYCNRECLHEDNSSLLCSHLRVIDASFYYLPVRDRIKRLLQSDLCNLLHYDVCHYTEKEVS